MSHKDRRLEAGNTEQYFTLAVSESGLDRRYEIWSYGLTCWVMAVYLAGR